MCEAEITLKTRKETRKKYTESEGGGCCLSIGGIFTPSLGGVKISLYSICYACSIRITQTYCRLLSHTS